MLFTWSRTEKLTNSFYKNDSAVELILIFSKSRVTLVLHGGNFSRISGLIKNDYRLV